jgi:hypothetical protein
MTLLDFTKAFKKFEPMAKKWQGRTSKLENEHKTQRHREECE